MNGFARNAIPATPACFMHRFSCMCMLHATDAKGIAQEIPGNLKDAA